MHIKTPSRSPRFPSRKTKKWPEPTRRFRCRQARVAGADGGLQVRRPRLPPTEGRPANMAVSARPADRRRTTHCLTGTSRPLGRHFRCLRTSTAVAGIPIHPTSTRPLLHGARRQGCAPCNTYSRTDATTPTSRLDPARGHGRITRGLARRTLDDGVAFRKALPRWQTDHGALQERAHRWDHARGVDIGTSPVTRALPR